EEDRARAVGQRQRQGREPEDEGQSLRQLGPLGTPARTARRPVVRRRDEQDGRRQREDDEDDESPDRGQWEVLRDDTADDERRCQAQRSRDGRGRAREERGAWSAVVEERGGPRTHAEAGAGPLQNAPCEEGRDVGSRREEDA